jgi:hypothetical protein
MRNKVLLTFDVEEFDVPLEYGNNIDFETQIKINTQGLLNVLQLVEKHNIVCTFFTTATYALQNPNLIKQISTKHEIASHGYYHSSFEVKDLKTAKEALENITGKTVYGFRMARLAPVDENEIIKAGYTYNSSMNPTWIPGRYNHLNKPRLAFFNQSLACIPTSVSPIFRIPLFWLGFKNYPFSFFKWLMKRTLRHDKFLSLYFHPWEFTHIDKFGLPNYISKHSGEKMLERLDKAIEILKKEADFISMKEYVDSLKE